MEIIRNGVINAPVDKVWEILGASYGDVCQWASRLNNSCLIKSQKVAVGVVRECDSIDGVFKEKIKVYDEEYYVLAYTIIEGLPSFAKKGGNSWKLKALDDGTTTISIKVELIVEGLKGFLLTPIVKRRFTKIANEILEELKYFVEKGVPHPRKIKGQQAYLLQA